MIIKEENIDYKRKGYITKFGNDNYNAKEAEIVNKYNNTNIGYLQDMDSFIRNIHKYINEISENYYNALYDESEINDIYTNLKRAENILFKTAKIL